MFVQDAQQRAKRALMRSAGLRWTVLILVIVLGWFLFFWAVNTLPSNGTTPAPASTSIPSGEF